MPVPTTDLSDLPASSFAGEEFCFDVNIANTGDVGFGPYLQIQLPAGITFTSSSFIGSPVATNNVGTFVLPDLDLVDPLIDTAVNGPLDGSLIIIQPPIGSIVAGGPDLIVNVCANIAGSAVIGDPLAITATPIFQFGDSATGNNGPVLGVTQTASVTPALVEFEKRLIAPEGERPPGSSWPVTYQLVADIANGNTITNLEFRDVLPPQLQYVASSITVTGTGATCVPSVLGQNISIDCASETGTLSEEDVLISYQAFVTDVLEESSCSSNTITNIATFDAQRFDTATSSNVPIAQITSQETLSTSNVEIQKSVSPGVAPNFVSPGDTLTYTVNIQTTEYGSVNSLIFNDLLPDGLENFQSVSVTGPSGSLAVTPTSTPNADGSISIVYDIHAVSGDLPAASAITLVYTADVAQSFTNPSTPVKANDFLTNTASITYGLVEGANSCTDESSATAFINPLMLKKEVVNPQAEFQPGDTVTYRLIMEIPSGDTSDIIFEDFFPLPVFDVTSLNLTYGVDIRRAQTVDTLNITPTAITVDSSANKLSIVWPDITTLASQTLAIDVDIVVGTQPFSDNLSLTNLFQASTSNTQTSSTVDLGLIVINVGAPVLDITKGVVSTSNPNSTIDAATIPTDSNLVDADGSDTITYEITVENTGGAPARDVIITDDLGMPAFLLESCSVNSVIKDGSTLVAGTDYTVTSPFNGVINLTDPLEKNDENPAGGGAPFSSDTIFVQIVCSVAQSVIPGQDIINTSSVVWSSAPNQPKFPAVSDDAQITVDDPEIEKSLLGSVTTFTIGDIIRYEITYTVPELTLNQVLLHDELDPGLAFVNVTNHTVTTSSGDITTSSSIFNITNNGSTLDLDLGTVINSNSDDSVTETIKISYDVVVVNDTNVNAGATLSNTANITSTNSNTSNVSANDITIVEPNIVVDKTVISTGPYDAGDVVTYDWHIRQEGTNLTTAYDVTLEDILPSGVVYNSNSLTLISGSCVNLIPDDTDPLILKATAVSFAATDDCHYQYSVTLDSSVTPVDGTDDIENTVAITWTSQPGTLATVTTPISIYNSDSCERTSATDPNACGSGNDYDEESTASVDIRDVVVQKLNNSTSESTTGITEDRPQTTDLAIGETSTYTIIVTIPEGTSQEITVRDNFPANANAVMEFLPAETIVTIGSDLTVTNDLSGIGTGTGVDARLSDGIIDRGQWEFGQVINNASDGIDGDGDNEERIIIEVTGRMVDNPANVSLNSSSNSVVVSFGTGLRDTSRIGLDIVEPLLEIDKSSTTTTADGGDSVTFSIKVKHTNASTQEAFDLVVTDIIPAGLVYVPGSLAEVSSPTCTVTATLGDSDPTGAGISASYDNLPKVDECELTFSATLANNVNPNQQITNIAGLTWDSLAADDDPNERDYSTNDDHQITVSSPGLSKIVFATSEASTDTVVNGPENDLTIGERVTYQFTATIPEGQSDTVVITDQLPNSDSGVVLRLISSRIVSIGTQLALTSVIGAAGDDCLVFNSCDSDSDGQRDLAQWNIGTITNTPDGASDANDQIVFEVIAVVTDAVANTGADDDVVNTATLTFGGGQMVSGTATVDIVEPSLTIEKQATPMANPFLVDAGDVITYEITVAHDTASNADAFNIQVVDTLPNNGTSALMNWNGDGNIGGTCVGTTVDSSTSGTAPFDIIFDVPVLPVLPSSSCTITYQVVVDNLVTPAQTLQNSAALAYDSTPNFVAGETRSSTGNAIADVVVTAPSMMVKTIASTSLADTEQSQHDVNFEDLAIGELVTYSISMKFPEGTTPNVILTDTMPSGVNGVIEIVGSPVITSAGNGITTSNSAITFNSDSFTIDFGSVLNEPNNVDNLNDFITVEVTGVVIDDNANIDGAQPINSATFSYTDGTDSVVNLTDTVTVDIVEPDMGIAKSMTVENGIATITVSLTNSGTASAYDIEIEDVLDIANWDTTAIVPVTVPAGFTLTTVAGPNVGDTTVLMATNASSTAPTNSIEPAETVTFVFTVPVKPSIASIVNTATNTNSTTIPGGSINERDEPDVASTATLLIPLIELEKTAAAFVDTNNDGEVGGVGDDITYIFNVINTGGVDLTNIIVTDANPLVTMSGNPISVVAGASNNTVTGTYTITQTDMNLGSVTNIASVTGDGPAGSGSVSDVSDDPNENDNVDANGDGEPDDPTVVTLLRNPLFNMEKTASPASLSAPGKIIYTFTFTNTGNVGLTNLTVDDPLIDANTLVCNGDNGTDDVTVPDGDIDSLTIDGVETCTAERTITQAQINLGASIINTATASATDLDGTTAVAEDSTTDNSTSTPIAQNPSYNMVKTASPASISAPGNITYTFTFTNTGNVDLTELSVIDLNIDTGTLVCSNDNDVNATIDVLVVGAVTQSCTATRAVSQAEINAGTALLNTASAFATGPNGSGGTASVTESDITDNNTTTPIAQNPSYNMVKTVNVDEITEPDIITYTFEFTNTGNIDLLDLSIIDSDIDVGSLLCMDDDDSDDTADDPSNITDTDESIPLLVVGTETKTCTAQRTITQDQINSGLDLVNTATPVVSVGYTQANGDPVVVEEDDLADNTATTTVAQNPSYNMVKTASPASISAPGNITYTFTFTNTGNVDLTNLTVADNNINVGSLVCQDDLDGDVAVNIDSLPVGTGTKTCTAMRTVTQEQVNLGVSLSNTAIPSATSADGITLVDETITSDNSVITPIIQQPAFDMAKTASPLEITEPGNITYTFTFTNTGNVALTNLTVTDLNIDIATLSCTDDNDGITGIDSLPVGLTKTCEATRAIDQTQINLGADLTNTATANVTGPNGTTGVVESNLENNSTVTSIIQTPSYNMVKTASPAEIVEPGIITYTFTFTNTGNVELTDLGIDDLNIDAGTLTCSNDANINATIDVLEVGSVTQSCTALRTVTQEQINLGDSLDNTATANVTAPDGNGGAVLLAETDESDNSTSTPVIQSPAFNMIKTAEPELITGPGEIIYTFSFTNTGNVDLANLRVIDNDIDEGSISCIGDEDNDLDIDQLAPNTTQVCTAVRTITSAQLSSGEPIVNEATTQVETLNGAAVVDELSLLDNRVSTPVMFSPTDIPTLSEWMLALLSVLLLLIGLKEQQNIKMKKAPRHF